MTLAMHIASWILLLGGSYFVVVGALGLLRLPDVFTRLHAVSVIDTMGAGMILAGLLLQAPDIFVAFRLGILALIFFMFTPVASHAIAQAALAAGIQPLLKVDRRGRVPGSAAEPAASNSGGAETTRSRT